MDEWKIVTVEDFLNLTPFNDPEYFRFWELVDKEKCGTITLDETHELEGLRLCL